MDFLAKFSRLVNGMGQALVLSWTKLSKAGDMKVAAETLQALEGKIPLMLQLLMHEDDDISANTVGFCYDYLHVLKQVHTHTFVLTAYTKSSAFIYVFESHIRNTEYNCGLHLIKNTLTSNKIYAYRISSWMFNKCLKDLILVVRYIFY